MVLPNQRGALSQRELLGCSTSATFAQSGAIHQYVRPPSTSLPHPMTQEAAAAQLSSADASTTTRAA
jgi:hypothetical protein